MKKVILESDIEEKKVYLKDLRQGDIIGLETIGGHKFFLLKNNNGFEWVGEFNIHSSSKPQYIDFKDSIEGYKNLFVFETYKELFKWLSE